VADPASVGVVILAAGSSRRLGRPKQLLPLDGAPLLQHVIDAADAADVGEIVVVLGHLADDIAANLALPPVARAIVNPDHSTGQASSLRAGIGALHARRDRAVVLLGDQPHVSSAAIRAVADAADPIARAAYCGTPGHPVAFRRSVWPELLAIEGDQGARAVLVTYADQTHIIEMGGHQPADVDTEADYDRLRRESGL
jgi:molybdenum cofactor cytidylyltransferase